MGHVMVILSFKAFVYLSLAENVHFSNSAIDKVVSDKANNLVFSVLVYSSLKINYYLK